MPTDLSGITLVIPTEGRVELTHQLLNSLKIARNQYTGPSEVIVIDSSPLHQSDAIRALCQVCDAIYFYGPSSVRSKRNIGIQHANFPITLFIDSDCTASSDLLQQHASVYLEAPEIGGCAGLVRFASDDRSFFWRMLLRTSFAFPFKAPSQTKHVLWGPTANTSYRTELLREVNGFDEKFPFKLGGDDVDLGLRVTALGYIIRTNPEAIVIHSPQTWHPLAVTRRALRWGRMHYFLFRKHPKQRTMTLPGMLTIFVLLLVIFALITLFSQQLDWLLVPFIWWVLKMLTDTVLLASTGRKPASVLRDLCASQFELLFDVGNVFEALRHLDIRPFYLTFSYQPLETDDANSTITLGERRVRDLWSIMISLAILMGGFLIW